MSRNQVVTLHVLCARTQNHALVSISSIMCTTVQDSKHVGMRDETRDDLLSLACCG